MISDKYLRSPYCMFEIYKLWQKSQTVEEDMAERVVPIVLPGLLIVTVGAGASITISKIVFRIFGAPDQSR